MSINELIIISKGDLKQAFNEWHREIEAEKASLKSEEMSYSINQVSIRLGRSHATVKKMVINGILRATADQKRISEAALNEYINKQLTNIKH